VGEGLCEAVRVLFEVKASAADIQDKQPLEQNLVQQARRHEWLVLWLDCDREGENISFEVCDL